MAASEPQGTPQFSLVAGGPFHALLARFGLLGPDLLPTPRAALGVAGLLWLVPALLAIAEAIAEGSIDAWRYFADLTVYSRFLVATGAMLLTERYADNRITLLTDAFRRADILTGQELPRFERALVAADRRSASYAAETAAAVLALIFAHVSTTYAILIAGSSWEGAVIDGTVDFSWAGNASRFFSGAVFLFLVFRWIWRFFVWARLLYDISRMPLQLTPLHPDRAGGLGFLAIYPTIFGGFVFALSCVVAASFLKELNYEQHAQEVVWLAIGVWIALIVFIFLGPLFVFARRLHLERERGLIDYGRLASRHHLAFHRKWIGQRTGDELLGSTDPSSAADLNASMESVQAIRIIPIDRVAVIQLVVSAGVPMIAVVAKLIPLPELARWIIGGLL